MFALLHSLAAGRYMCRKFTKKTITRWGRRVSLRTKECGYSSIMVANASLVTQAKSL